MLTSGDLEAIYQFKILVRGSRPPIWRRLQTPDISLARLHRCLQAVTGWSDAFLHAFSIQGRYCVDREQHKYAFLWPPPPPPLDDSKVTLSVLELIKGEWFIYEYGPWRLRIIFEKTRLPRPDTPYPICVKGRRACPPEQLNGLKARRSVAAALRTQEQERREGYDEFLAAMQDCRHPKHKMRREWWGGKFNPEAFDLEEANEALRQVK